MNKVFTRRGRSLCYGMKDRYHTYEQPGTYTQIRRGQSHNNIIAVFATSGGVWSSDQSPAAGNRLARKIVRLLNNAAKEASQ